MPCRVKEVDRDASGDKNVDSSARAIPPRIRVLAFFGRKRHRHFFPIMAKPDLVDQQK
jgi:hypothetical protein